MAKEAPSTDDFDLLDAGTLERRRLRNRALVFLMSLFTACVGLDRYATSVSAFLRREIDVFGNPVFVPLDPVSPEAFASIDFEFVHEEVIPTYVRALSTMEPNGSRRRVEYAHRHLLHTLEADPNLVELWRELHLLAMLDPIRNARRIDYLLWAHNHYLEVHRVNFRLEAALTLYGDRPRLVTRSYRVLEDTHDAEGHRARFLQRLDHLALTETWLGHTDRESDGAMLVADRILHFSIRHLWPGLVAALDQRRPARERGALPLLRREAQAAIDPELYAVLVETAEDQQALLDAAQSIHARHRCGSRFHVYDLPYRGLSRRSYAALAMAIERSRGSSCPDVTLSEAAQIVGASERLSQTPRLEDALEALAAFGARAVAAHEVRHVADGPSRQLACPGCPPMPSMARAELSAYLASFGAEGIGGTAALIACSNPQTERGVDAQAIRLAVEAALPNGCEGAYPADFHARAQAAEARYFGTRSVAALPANFPAAPRLLARRERVAPVDLSWLVEDDVANEGAISSQPLEVILTSRLMSAVRSAP